MGSILIIDYGMGNLQSVANAFEAIGEKVLVSNKKSDIDDAEKIVLPGVGAFEIGMQNLRKSGIIGILKKNVLVKKKPFLGICLGMQLLASKGRENGLYAGLDWIQGTVEKLNPPDKSLKIPHVGWNDVLIEKQNPLFSGFKPPPTFYFVHSYHFVCKNKADEIAFCDYGGKFVSAVQKGNIFAVQFHPEKSQQNGLQLLKNFVDFTG